MRFFGAVLRLRLTRTGDIDEEDGERAAAHLRCRGESTGR